MRFGTTAEQRANLHPIAGHRSPGPTQVTSAIKVSAPEGAIDCSRLLQLLITYS